MQNEETAMRNARDDGVTVRPATEGDAALLLGLNREVQALHAAAEPGRFKPVVTDTAPFVAMVNTPEAQTYIADVAGTPAGYVHIVVQRRPENPFTYAATIVHIDQIAVCSTYRRHGVGTALLDRAKALAAELATDRVTLDVWSFNTVAQTFFARQGFTTYTERRRLTSDE
jgi:ribosomal protein S18 acetylase RimI-like enzyme